MPCAVVITSLPIEYLAVRAHLTDVQEVLHPKGMVYERGKFSAYGRHWEVGIVEVSAGNAPAALEAERVIAYFNPDVILFVGIVGGIKDVKLGDVVVGDVIAVTKVYGYESDKVEQTFKPRPYVGLSSFRMVARATVEARKKDWLQRLKSPVPNLSPSVFVAPIAAGEKVVANKEPDLFKFLQNNYDDAVAVEMEERGGILKAAYANQQVSALVIRGISDLIEGKGKADEISSQEIAAINASAFAFEVLAKLNLNQPNLVRDVVLER